ncbi:MAG TPA: HAMP domain-containing sensor histidine kinase [Desulfosporosinus sp.]|nr:HAMP domain-containing sensor histidine kinase [Desulfosporosinus sp.]
MLDRKPLKTQFILSFILIIVISLIATIITYYAGYNIYTNIEYRKLYPANYYERKIPDIEGYLRNKGIALLSSTEKQSLEKVIPSEGILYRVMDGNAHTIYKTDGNVIINDKEDLYSKINTTTEINGRYVRIIPIIDSQGRIAGAVSLSYLLKLSYQNAPHKIWILPLYIVIIFSPFIYITVFTLLFSKKFAGNIGKPVNMLIKASKKVKEKDLDFHIDYNADNELGTLCKVFNEMKDVLKESLISKWKIEQERHEMVEALAHDLKAPFSVIQAYVESLLEGEVDDKQKITNYLHVIKENTKRGAELIKEMLYAEELESLDTVLHIVSVDVDSFMLRKKESYEIMAKEKTIKFKVAVNNGKLDKKSCTCNIDSEKLERILDNIVLNSIRYTPEHGTITINVDINEECIRLLVSDTGKGYSSKDLANLFNKFYKGDQSRSSKDGHSGLGLYIVKKLVDVHFGSIRAFNSKEGGACTELVLYYRLNV